MYPELSDQEILRYSRHLLLDEVGQQGQRKLKAASMLVVGCGGVGSAVSLYLAAAGVGHIGIVDHDEVEISNLQRQVIHSSSTLGMPKVESARQRMLELNPGIQVDAYAERFTAHNAMRIAADYDVLIDGTDNFPTRYLINDVGVLSGKPFVYGSVLRFEGQVSVLDARRGPCYRCLVPEAPKPGSVPTVAGSGVLGMLPGTIGTIQAAEALKLVLDIGEPLVGRLLLYNALDMSLDMVDLSKNLNCKICGMEPEITSLDDKPECYHATGA